MTLEQMCCSLEHSKKLRELGVPQDSVFYWWRVFAGTRGEKIEISLRKPSKATLPDECYSAFISGELGEMLPSLINYEITPNKIYQARSTQYSAYGGKWSITFWEQPKDKNKEIIADTEADARALMVIYLLENKLINL